MILGTSTIADLKLGSAGASKAYLGASEVWTAGGGGGLPAENGNVVNNTFSGSNTSGIQTVFASQEAEPAWLAMDGDPDTKWRAFNPPRQFGIDFGQPEVIYSIEILGAFANPTSFLVQSSPDGATWTTRRVVSGATLTPGAYNAFAMTTPFQERWCRLDISASADSGTRIYAMRLKS